MTPIAPPKPEIHDLVSQPTVAVRVTRSFADLPAAFPQLLPRVMAGAGEQGGLISGPPYARYHRVAEGTIDVEIGAPVVRLAASLPRLSDLPAGQVGASELPAGPAAVLVHTGPYDGVGATWALAEEWLRETDHRAAGPGWEVYVDDPASVPPDRLRTQVILPLEAADR
jgi:AraC family transcriptional regulator